MKKKQQTEQQQQVNATLDMEFCGSIKTNTPFTGYNLSHHNHRNGNRFFISSFMFERREHTTQHFGVCITNNSLVYLNVQP